VRASFDAIGRYQSDPDNDNHRSPARCPAGVSQLSDVGPNEGETRFSLAGRAVPLLLVHGAECAYPAFYGARHRKWNNYLIGSLADRRRYFSPSWVYSIKTNLDLTVGVQLFRDTHGREYGRLDDVYFTQLQWFF
jgi:hypothetical protein